MTVGEINAKCPECENTENIGASTLPGFARCPSCGKVFPAPAERARAEADDAEAAPQLVVPDQIAVEYGWRAWGIRRRETDAGMTLLESVSHNAAFWQPRIPMEAVCNRGCGDVPGNNCRCGLYSAKDLDHLHTMPHYYNYDPQDCFKVIGKVALWGKVIEGSQGWRAQFGYPSELYLPFEAWYLHDELKDAYGVPVRLKNFLRKEN